MPEGVEVIGDGAFAECPGLTQVTLPASVTEIGSDPFGGSPVTSRRRGLFADENTPAKRGPGSENDMLHTDESMVLCLNADDMGLVGIIF